MRRRVRSLADFRAPYFTHKGVKPFYAKFRELGEHKLFLLSLDDPLNMK